MDKHGESLKKRFSSCKSNPTLLQIVSNAIDNVIQRSADISGVLREKPETVPEQTRDLVSDGLVSANDAFALMDQSITSLEYISPTKGTGNESPGPSNFNPAPQSLLNRRAEVGALR